ncbi:MAG TPA: hypothetical protein VOA80_21995 [Thermoanaerobaculia bacterium]|nr:hypothetical protein [Thermoanaerobaculia bacterium]
MADRHDARLPSSRWAHDALWEGRVAARVESGGDAARGLLADAVGEGLVAGAEGLVVGAGGEVRHGQVAGSGADQAVVLLDAPDGLAGPGDVGGELPRAAVVADAVDDEMDVLLVGVAMGDDHDLAAVEAHAAEDAVDGLVPLLGSEVPARQCRPPHLGAGTGPWWIKASPPAVGRQEGRSQGDPEDTASMSNRVVSGPA